MFDRSTASSGQDTLLLMSSSEWMRKNNPMKRPEVAAKVAAKRRGRPLGPMSNEHKAKIREANKEHLRRLAQSNVGNKYSVGRTDLRGRKHTPETRAKMRVAAARRIQATEGTSIELKVMEVLKGRGEDFVHQYAFPGERYVFDFAIPSKRVLIEVDGCYWHGCFKCGHDGMPDNRRNDAAKNRLAKRLGWKLIRIKECNI